METAKNEKTIEEKPETTSHLRLVSDQGAANEDLERFPVEKKLSPKKILRVVKTGNKKQKITALAELVLICNNANTNLHTLPENERVHAELTLKRILDFYNYHCQLILESQDR